MKNSHFWLTQVLGLALFCLCLSLISGSMVFAEENSESDPPTPIGKPMPGGWAVYDSVDQDAKAILEKAINKRVGVMYVPIAYAQQTVAGFNYCFICIAIPATADPVPNFCVITFFVGTDNKISKFDVKDISFDPEEE